MVSVQEGRFVPIPFATMIDPATGRTRVRTVNTGSLRYAVARRLMTRLERDDLSDPRRLAACAKVVGLDTVAFARRFGPVVEHERQAAPLMTAHGA